MTPTETDVVNHPRHYNNIAGVECIDVVREFNFNRGNAIKYIWRAGAKGDEVEDLCKAVWYLEDEIKRLRRSRAADDIRAANINSGMIGNE